MLPARAVRPKCTRAHNCTTAAVLEPPLARATSTDLRKNGLSQNGYGNDPVLPDHATKTVRTATRRCGAVAAASDAVPAPRDSEGDDLMQDAPE
eukprot:11182716-Lingulodinium_polyedra.AAC.1